MDHFLAPNIQEQLRQEIAEALGNEVFCIGHTDEDQRVVDLETLARGNKTAVPAIIQACRPGDVIIHNHPSGHLEPSGADLDIAGNLGALGIGFYIVNNSVSKLYRVVEAFKPAQLATVEHQQIADILGADGKICQHMAEFEDRPEQLRMAFAVTEAFNRHKIALRCLRIMRMLWPQPQSTAKRASPSVPFKGHRVRRPSFFMCPIIGSIALRRRRSLAMVLVTPRRAPLMKTFTFSMPWPRYPRSTKAMSGRWSVRISTCSRASLRVWPS